MDIAIALLVIFAILTIVGIASDRMGIAAFGFLLVLSQILGMIMVPPA
jgi:hypothetical protein